MGGTKPTIPDVFQHITEEFRPKKRIEHRIAHQAKCPLETCQQAFSAGVERVHSIMRANLDIHTFQTRMR